MAEEKVKCSGKCGRELAIGNFYKSKSPFFPSGYVNICKKCISEMVDYNDINTIYTVMQILDIPFFYNRWEETCSKHKEKPLGHYIRMANSGLNEFNGARYKDSVFKATTTNKIIKDSNNESNDKLLYLKDKFGEGYQDKEYILFEKKYQDLRPSFQLLTTMHEECLREYCIDKVKEGLAKAKGDFKEAKEWASMAKDVASSGKLNPSQMSKADLTGGLDTFGQMSRMVEQTDEGELMNLFPKFIEQPKDKVDVTLWMYVNYVRDLKGLEECEYKDIYQFYQKRIQEYEDKMLDKEDD